MIKPESNRVMSRSSRFVAALAAIMIAVAPGVAFARAGGGLSFGSRGGFTYSAPPATRTAPYSASPMQRSLTAPYAPSPYAPGYGSYGGSGYGRSPFMSGLMGGLLGAGIGGLLFGGGFFGGMHGFGGFFGLLLQIFLLVMLGRFLLNLLFRQPVFAGGGVPRGASFGFAPQRAAASGSARQLAVGEADYRQFEQILYGVQQAWSNHDLSAMQRLATPEMVGYFAEQLGEQASRGLRNVVSEVRLQQGDLAQAWSEPGRDYATVAMRFSMIDATYDATGRVVEGSPSEHVTATEVWTFLRASGGRWVLSAIQQAR
jgi:predicted lipid-binding transport protein (Tim44 family)